MSQPCYTGTNPTGYNNFKKLHYAVFSDETGKLYRILKGTQYDLALKSSGVIPNGEVEKAYARNEAQAQKYIVSKNQLSSLEFVFH